MELEYYIFTTEEEAFEKSEAVYNLNCVKPPSKTLYGYTILTNGSGFAMECTGFYNLHHLVDGLTPKTEQEVLNEGYNTVCFPE